MAGQIGVRVINDVGEFYDTVTAEPFVPRGTNYVRIGPLGGSCRETGVTYHTTFNVGEYDACASGRALARMSTEGYNTVRVFLSHPCLARPVSDSIEYLNNLVDFLQRAKNEGVFVILTIDFIPAPYGQGIPPNPQIQDINAFYLRPQYVAAAVEFWQDLVAALASTGAPLDAVFAYELHNEQAFTLSAPPLSLTSGLVATANGQTYDMSSATAKQAMMDENLVYYIDTLRSAIRALDSSALVTCGFTSWPPPLVSRAYWVIQDAGSGGSAADFVDLHAYPGVGPTTLQAYVNGYELSGLTKKPVVMGEFGSFTFAYSVESAASVLQQWQTASCGYGFDGWLHWTWNTDEQLELWNGLSQCGLIDSALAPQNRPDACAAGPIGGPNNVALFKPVSVSAFVGGNEPALAVDGLRNTHWSAGNFAPQWIEVDLGVPLDIGMIRLFTEQFPSGQTTHIVYGRGPGTGGVDQELHVFSGITTTQQELTVPPSTPWAQIQYVRIETVESPSWVSWSEIEVLTAFSPGDTDGDGVCDSDDTCAAFDDTVDSDGDEVPDGCDVRPGGNDHGDSDGDGVADLCDACPGHDDHAPCPPIPALGAWGQTVLLLGVLCIATVVLRRRTGLGHSA